MSTRLAIILAAVVVAVGLGAGLGVGLSGSGTSPSTSVDQSQLASIRTACQQWLDDAPTEPGTSHWCTDMTQWMSSYLDHDGVGPQAMWGDPGSLARSCDQWLRTNPPSGAPADGTSWCQSMVSWMNANMYRWSGQGSWGNWMRDGPMMRGFGAPTEPATTPSTSSPAGGSGYGDTDYDGDCARFGDTDHDGDCGSGYGSGAGPGSGPGYGPGYRGPGYMMGF